MGIVLARIAPDDIAHAHMRTTVTLDPDTAALVQRRMREQESRSSRP